MVRAPELQEHWNRVAELPCVVSHQKPASLHHCHGGSMRDVGVHKGVLQKTSDWLIIPLAPEYHYIGPLAIDGQIGVATWERRFGLQVDFLDYVCMTLGVNVWKKAGIDREVTGC